MRSYQVHAEPHTPVVPGGPGLCDVCRWPQENAPWVGVRHLSQALSLFPGTWRKSLSSNPLPDFSDNFNNCRLLYWLFAPDNRAVNCISYQRLLEQNGLKVKTGVSGVTWTPSQAGHLDFVSGQDILLDPGSEALSLILICAQP